MESDDLISHAVTQAAAGDADAIRFLFVRVADDVEEHVREVVSDRSEVREIVHAVFDDLPDTLPSYESAADPFTDWILGLAERVAGARHPGEQFAWDGRPAARDSRRGPRTARDALLELPPEQREVLILHHLAGLSFDDIARRLGVPEDEVSAAEARANDAFRSGR
jgi:DNA-directed RNA polymerase specialized sigma24 family protein